MNPGRVVTASSMSLRRPHTDVTPYLGAGPLAPSSSSPSNLRLFAAWSSATTLSRRISILRRRAARPPASPAHSPFRSGDPAATSQQISAMERRDKQTDPASISSNQTNQHAPSERASKQS